MVSTETLGGCLKRKNLVWVSQDRYESLWLFSEFVNW